MNPNDNEYNSTPHLHVEYHSCNAAVEIPFMGGDGEILDGALDSGVLKTLQVWMWLRRIHLYHNWGQVIEGKKPDMIRILK